MLFKKEVAFFTLIPCINTDEALVEFMERAVPSKLGPWCPKREVGLAMNMTPIKLNSPAKISFLPTVSPRNNAPATAVQSGERKVRTVASERERNFREK